MRTLNTQLRAALRRGLPLAGLALLFTLAAAAQPGGGGPEPGPGNGGGGATDVPLDGGVSLLLASGVAYGLRRLRRR